MPMLSTPWVKCIMNLLADESIDRQIVDKLRQDGHEVLYVAELAPSEPDEKVLYRANSLQAVLITAEIRILESWSTAWAASTPA